MAIVARCSEAAFRITGKEEVERIEGVEVFKYLRRLLERSDYDWTAVLHKIRKARQVWGRFRKLLQRKGAEPDISETFYHTVLQVVLLYGS